jgi:hypothetical protein
MGCNHIEPENNREIFAILQKYQKKGHANCSRKIYCNIGKQIWKLNNINGWYGTGIHRLIDS